MVLRMKLVMPCHLVPTPSLAPTGTHLLDEEERVRNVLVYDWFEKSDDEDGIPSVELQVYLDPFLGLGL